MNKPQPLQELNMCGSIKYEMTGRTIGKPIPATIGQPLSAQLPDGSFVLSKWQNHIREESGPPTLPHKEVKVYATEYTEKDSATKKAIHFKVPRGQAISAYLVKNEQHPKGSGIFIKTRSATKEELEKCNHNRHPVFINRKK